MTGTRAMLLCTVVVGVLTSGCGVPMASEEMDLAARRFRPPPGRANLYVYRNENFGAAVVMQVLLDGIPLGQTAANTFLFTELRPGRHVILSRTAEMDSSVVVDASAGRNYFLWQEVKWGVWSARSLLQAVDERTGREGVAGCRMAVSTPPLPPSSAPPAPASAGCGKDTDCKGNRICRKGECVDPAPDS